MKRILLIVFPVFLILVSASSCNNKKESHQIQEPVFSTYIPTAPADTNAIKEIYYGLLTPVEVCNIFERLDLSYNDTILNAPDNADLYMSSFKAAMNLGVYGVDMGYMKLFGVNRQTVSYFMTISKLSQRLNIPEEFLANAIRGVDPNMSDADSLTGLMTDTYQKIDEYLRLEGSEGTLGLMMMGGWIESMYLSSQLAYDPANPDPQVVEKLAEQKYSLLSLLTYMKNYYDDPMVVFYTKKLKYLDRWFNSFDIYYKKGDVTIDTTRKVITTTGSEMTVTVETLNQIRDYIAKLRKEIVMV